MTREGRRITSQSPIWARSDTVIPLSSAQRSVWFLRELDSDATDVDIVLAKRLSGLLDRDALDAAIRGIVNRHEPLRCVIVEQVSGEPTQRVLDVGAAPVFLDLCARFGRDADEDETLSAVTVLLPGFTAGEPPFRWGLVKTGTDVHVLVIAVHPIAFDDWSVDLFWHEFEVRYAAHLRGDRPDVPESPFGYLDYAARSRARRPGVAEYWREVLHGATPPAELPADRARAAVPAHRRSTVRSTVHAALAERLRALGRQRQMTLFTVLEAAFSILVFRWTGARDVVIGTPVSGRSEPGTESLLGRFVNMLPLRFHMDPWSSVEEALQEAQATCLGAFAHQEQAFEDIARCAAPTQMTGRHPLFDLVFVVMQSARQIDLPGLNATDLPLPPTTSQLDLTFTVYDRGGDRELDVVVEYDSDLFDEATMTRFAAQWQQLLRGMADDPSRMLCDLELMSAEERLSLLAAGDRIAERAPFAPITALIADAVTQHADEVAIELGADQLTYRDLGRLASHLAEQLGAYGVRRGDVVAVAVERGIELVIAQLAVLMYGAVLLPIDVDQPLRRIDAMLSDAHAQLVLASDAGAIGLSNMLPVLDVVTSLSAVPVHRDIVASGFAAVRPDDASYVLFTSGSTGRPKGVVNTHVGIANRVAWMQDTYRLTCSDRVLYKTPVAFDVAMWEWLWPLTVGARVVVAEPDAHKDPLALARTITHHGVTITHFIPSMLRLFAAQPDAHHCRSLRQIVCSGEELTAVAVEEALRICPSIDNLYGPTEAAIDVTRWVCGPGEARVPIGGPISGVCLRVVDETGALVPVGVPGELLVGGVAVARGYAFRAGLTGRAFVPDPWGDGDRLYRTGDRVRWREPGVLEFLGRLDAQVKIRGARVEPGEVESVLGAYPGVVESAVVVRVDAHRGPQLVAFVSGRPGPAELRRHLRMALPEAMVPTAIEKVEAMPRTVTGKIDRTALASRAFASVAAGARPKPGGAEEPETNAGEANVRRRPTD